MHMRYLALLPLTLVVGGCHAASPDDVVQRSADDSLDDALANAPIGFPFEFGLPAGTHVRRLSSSSLPSPTSPPWPPPSPPPLATAALAAAAGPRG